MIMPEERTEEPRIMRLNMPPFEDKRFFRIRYRRSILRTLIKRGYVGSKEIPKMFRRVKYLIDVPAKSKKEAIEIFKMRDPYSKITGIGELMGEEKKEVYNKYKKIYIEERGLRAWLDIKKLKSKKKLKKIV